MEYLSLNRSIPITRHAQGRMCQRGIKIDDLEIIRKFGEQVVDGYLMSNNVIEQCIYTLKRQLQQLERLRGVALIEAGDCVVTVYRADKKRVNRLRQRSLSISALVDNF